MYQAAQKISSEQARKLFPLGKLNQDDTEELLRGAITSRLPAGAPLFHTKDLPKQVFYLLAGEVELITKDKGRRLIKSGTVEARKPMGRGISGHLSATTRKESLIVSFDADMLELFLSWSNPEAYLVSEMNTGSSGEWLDRLLQSRGLLRFSEEQIQTLLNRMSEVHLNAGDVVIHQDDQDDYYYIIKNGSCSVSRQPAPGAKEIKLAELRQGDAFGEEALLANTPRTANIVMTEEGDLMRLSKEDFSTLLAEPLLTTVRWEESHNLIKMGATFLDIRLPDEFEKESIPGSVNIPLSLLRLKIKQLSHARKYIVYCNDGSRSAVAAFLLNRHGFDAYILDGGLLATHVIKDEDDYPYENSGTSVPAEALFTSLADQWGATVDEPLKASFEDSSEVDMLNKTQPMTTGATATTTPAALTRSVKPAVSRTTTRQPEIDIDFILASNTERKRTGRLIVSALALAILTFAAAIPVYMEMSAAKQRATPAALHQDQGEFLRPNSNATTSNRDKLSATTMGGLTMATAEAPRQNQ